MRGRPKISPKSRQVNVLIPEDAYQAMANLVEHARVMRPGYSIGDLMREFIDCRLEQLAENCQRPCKLPVGQDRVRRLHAIARAAVTLAHELERDGCRDVEAAS